MIILTIFRPFCYLKIKHEGKWMVDWLLPSVLSILTILIFYALSNMQYSMYIKVMLSDDIRSFVQILPGFYIAALSAVTVFNRTDLDKHMPEPTPRMKSFSGKIFNLTRRRFLAVTFSFLTAQSFVFLVLISMGDAWAYAVNMYFQGWVEAAVKLLSCFFSLLIFYQIVSVTFVCLYYLGERLHQPDS